MTEELHNYMADNPPPRSGDLSESGGRPGFSATLGILGAAVIIGLTYLTHCDQSYQQQNPSTKQIDKEPIIKFLEKH